MLTSPDPTHGEVVVTATGETCFYCHATAYNPAVMWSGATGEIYFHPPCAVDLMLRLSADILKWQYQGEGARYFGERPQ